MQPQVDNLAISQGQAIQSPAELAYQQRLMAMQNPVPQTGTQPAGQVQGPQAVGATQPSPFSLTVPDQLPSDALAFPGSVQSLIAESSARERELTQQRIAQEEALRQREQEVLDSMKLTPEEQEQRMRLAETTTAIREREAALHLAVEGIRRGSGGTLAGASEAITAEQRNAQADLFKLNLSQLAASETLKALTGFREAKLDVAKTALGFEDRRLERILGLEKEFRNETRNLSSELRQETRRNMMEMVNMGLQFGVSFDELPQQDQESLINWATQTPGMSVEMMVSALEKGKVVYNEQRQKAAAALAQTRAQTELVREQTRAAEVKRLDIEGARTVGGNISQILRGQTVLRDVNRALGLVDRAGGIGGFVAGRIDAQGEPTFAATLSPAFELQQHLDSIKSNISIDQLQLMREASPTGGALGQVPVRQQQYLMSVLGSLKATLSPEILQENLNDVFNIYLDTMFGAPEELSQAVRSGKMSHEQANIYLQMRKETGFNEFNLPVSKSGGQVITNMIIAPDGTLYNLQ